jgi:hypothetical protein
MLLKIVYLLMRSGLGLAVASQLAPARCGISWHEVLNDRFSRPC